MARFKNDKEFEKFYHQREYGTILYCPFAKRDLKPGEVVFQDNDRPGYDNACTLCHSDKRSIADRLRDLERQRN